MRAVLVCTSETIASSTRERAPARHCSSVALGPKPPSALLHSSSTQPPFCQRNCTVPMLLRDSNPGGNSAGVTSWSRMCTDV